MSNTLALGRHPVDLSIYSKVAAHETKLQDGVVRMDCGWRGCLPRLQGCGVKSRLDRDGSLLLEVNIVVKFGVDAKAVGAAVQEAVLRGVGRISDRPIGAVDVVVRGFEFIKSERRPYERSVSA